MRETKEEWLKRQRASMLTDSPEGLRQYAAQIAAAKRDQSISPTLANDILSLVDEVMAEHLIASRQDARFQSTLARMLATTTDDQNAKKCP